MYSILRRRINNLDQFETFEIPAETFDDMMTKDGFDIKPKKTQTLTGAQVTARCLYKPSKPSTCVYVLTNGNKMVKTPPPAAGKWDSLPGALIREGCNGYLNPVFVEWLMGVPPGWTDLEH